MNETTAPAMAPSLRAEEAGGDDMAARLDAMQPEQCADEAARYAAREAARRLLTRLETPYEQAFTLAVATPMLVAALETCRELGLWARWTAVADADADAGAPKTLDDLLAMCRVPAEVNLLRRLLRPIATYGVLRETGEDAWAPTAFSRALGDAASHLGLTLKAGADQLWGPALHLPGFLSRHGYAEPLDAAGAGGDVWTELNGCDYFESHRREPGRAADFAALMTATRNYKTDWTAVYDTARLFEEDGEEEEEGADGDGEAAETDEETDAPPPPFFVDVGACHGLDAARLLARHPELPAGSLVIEDLPDILESAVDATAVDAQRIRRVAHDFFTPQPTTATGARAYFFHAVLHDWSDEACGRILGHAVTAMRTTTTKAGRRRRPRQRPLLLVYDVVLPAQAAGPFQTALDLALMVTLSGRERTEDQWRRLLADAGLRVRRIFRLPRAVESVIEAELA